MRWRPRLDIFALLQPVFEVSQRRLTFVALYESPDVRQLGRTHGLRWTSTKVDTFTLLSEAFQWKYYMQKMLDFSSKTPILSKAWDICNLIILLSEMLKFSNFVICEEQEIFCERKYWIFKNILVVKLKISKLIIYSTRVCQSCQGTLVV
jgi:hypothetical protein